MKTDKPYERRHAEALLLPCREGDRWKIDEKGVWPDVDFLKDRKLGLVPEYKVLSWKPAMVFKDDPHAPDCAITPALPFPFDARDLAAFMLAGYGALLASCFGKWKDGPYEDAIDEIDPCANHARRAVREAFDAYREAKRVIGCREGEEPNIDEMVRELLKPTGGPCDTVQPQAAVPAPVAGSASNAPACNFSMLATRDQLIDVFGRFTGMDASWFKNLTDTPALLAARKLAGQGGRGHIAEPFFCPFEVMQWLADAKRRKGTRKLSAEKAWELLEKNFPKVYNAHSIADPRAGD